MKVYTKTGDSGETGLFGGARVSKADERVAAYGDIDELNSHLGLARVHELDDSVDGALAEIQCRLFDLGAELATAAGKEDKLTLSRVSDADCAALEGHIDRAEDELDPLRTFVLPGGSAASAHLHLARTVCRRAERSVVALSHRERVRPEVIRYVNRLSDLLFVWARLSNRRAGVADVPWKGREA